MGCICPNITCCHGHLLAKLAQGEKDLKNVFDETSLSIDARPVVFFKGEKCPLSNCYFNTAYPVEIKDDEEEAPLNFPFGMCQAFTAMKCRDLGWNNMESSIREVKNITELNTVLKSFDVRSQSVKPSKPWKVSRTLEVMFELLKAKHIADLKFRSFCEKLGPKVPCKATFNKYWGCGIDMEVLHSLDPRLLKETVMGHNTLGWLIKIVHTEHMPSEDFGWIRPVLNSDYFPQSMKDGLQDVIRLLSLTECGLLDGGKVSWKLKKETKILRKKKNGGVRKKVKSTQSGGAGGETPPGEQPEVDKGVQLEKGYEENDVLECP